MSFVSCPPLRRLPVAHLAPDPTAPRMERRAPAATDPLLQSIHTLGVLLPLTVVSIRKHRYQILDGHRRFVRARRLGLTTLPCLVYAHGLSPARVARLRLAWHTTPKSWTAAELAQATAAVRAMTVASAELPPSVQQALRRLPNKYAVELRRCTPKLRPLGRLTVSAMLKILAAKVRQRVITNAAEFRRLGKLFDRDATSHPALLRFLQTPRSSIRDLEDAPRTHRPNHERPRKREAVITLARRGRSSSIARIRGRGR